MAVILPKSNKQWVQIKLNQSSAYIVKICGYSLKKSCLLFIQYSYQISCVIDINYYVVIIQFLLSII